MVPDFDGALFPPARRDALWAWARFFMRFQCYRERAIAEELDVATAGARSDAADAVDNPVAPSD